MINIFHLNGTILASKDMESLKDAMESCVRDGAYLGGAYLGGAYLRGAYLRGAYLGGAYLGGANLGDLGKIMKILQIGPIGSRADWLVVFYLDTGIYVSTGCFQQRPIAEFAAAITKTHGDNDHARHYRAAITLIEALAPREEQP